MSLPAEQGVIKALKIAGAAKRNGWHGNIDAETVIDGICHTKITAERNDEAIGVLYIGDAYQEGRYTLLGRASNLHCASVALERVESWPDILVLFKEFPQYNKVDLVDRYRRLPFSETTESNADIMEKLLGQHLTWYSHEFARMDDDTVMPPRGSKAKQYRIADVGHRKIFHFIGAKSGFRSVLLDTVIKVGMMNNNEIGLPITVSATPDFVDYALDHFLKPEDEVLQRIRQNTVDKGLPAIEVSAQQGKMLETLVRSSNAVSILEVGTLAGYSTLCLLRGALSNDIRASIITLEFDPKHAVVAEENLMAAGHQGDYESVIGDAHETMTELVHDDEVFDFIFIDADKESNGDYLKLALQLSRRGTTIVVDNVIRDGRVLDPARADKLEFIKTIGTLVESGQLVASVVQTVGSKGWDGFVHAVVL